MVVNVLISGCAVALESMHDLSLINPQRYHACSYCQFDCSVERYCTVSTGYTSLWGLFTYIARQQSLDNHCFTAVKVSVIHGLYKGGSNTYASKHCF